MKKIVLPLFFLFLGYSSAHAKEPLRFAKIAETPDQEVGAEILKVAYGRLGIPVVMVEMPGRRALAESSQGKVDGEVHRIFGVEKDYPTLVRVPTPINYIEPTVFTKKMKLKVTGCEDLAAYRIGIVRGVKHAENCTKGMKNIQVVNDSRLLMKILNRERVDLAITARINGLLQIKELKLEGIFALSPPLSREPLYHYLHAKNESLVPQIDKVFKEMERDGTLESLRRRYTGKLLGEPVAGKFQEKNGN